MPKGFLSFCMGGDASTDEPVRENEKWNAQPNAPATSHNATQPGAEDDIDKKAILNAYSKLITDLQKSGKSDVELNFKFSLGQMTLVDTMPAAAEDTVIDAMDAMADGNANATTNTTADVATDPTENAMVGTVVNVPTKATVEAPTTPATEIPLIPAIEMPTSTSAIEALTEMIPDIFKVAVTPEDVKQGVDTFLDIVPHVLQALDEVANIHPYIKVAVVAFKAVYKLYQKRQENDKRVVALYVEMKDMMTILLQLRGVSDPQLVTTDGQTIEGRMQTLCFAVAEDIRNCANACDTYTKKRPLVKVFAGPIWDLRLTKYSDIFEQRRKDFHLAMSIHTTVSVNAATDQLARLLEETGAISERMRMMMELFQGFITFQEKKLGEKVEEIGGRDVALADEQMMEELVDEEFVLVTNQAPGSHSSTKPPFDFEELRQDIATDPDEAIEKNAKSFNRKFEIQTKQIEAMPVENRDGSRIIDQHILQIWKETGWRGSVKAQHFVMTLRDHYVEKAARHSAFLINPDSWALTYINIGRARGIQEAFDGDASGVVTINGVNNFTQSKPPDWSLPHWMAYCAIGWQMTCTIYCIKIEEIFDAMIRLSYEVLPENRQAVSDYINRVWRLVTVFVRSIEREEGTERLRSKFESYVAAEESRVQRGFEEFKYQIDGSDTIQFVCGEGRLEMTLFPMFYLTLKRDLRNISLARKHVLPAQELVEARTTIDSIVDLASHRIEHLKSIFTQQDLDTKSQFVTFAKGLYNLGSARGLFFPNDQLRELPDPIPCRNDVIPEPDSIPPESVLNNPISKRLEINLAAFRPPEPTLSSAENDHPVLGVHYGFIYLEGKPVDPMIKLTFSKGDSGHTFVAAGAHYRGGKYKDYRIIGGWGPPSADGTIPVQLKITYSTTDWDNTELRGTFDPKLNTLKGTSDMPVSKRTGEFVFKRDPDIVRFHPAPSTMTPRKWWRFATTSVLDRVRQQAWSPTRISKRIKDRKRFMELTLRESYYGIDLDVDEEDELLLLFLDLCEADVQLCASLMDIHRSETPAFTSVVCDNCGNHPVGSRTICIDCTDPTVNLCSEQECLHSTITFEAADRKPHLPSHGMFKVYRFIFDRDTARIERTAKETLNFAHWSVSQLVKKQEQMPGCARCNVPVSLPCWCCVECTEEKFICDDCELNQLSFDETHTKMHTVVRVSDEDEGKGPSTEEQLRLVKDELAKMRQDFEEVTQTVAEMRQSFVEVTQMVAEMRRGFVEVTQTTAEMKQTLASVGRSVEGYR